MCPNVYRQCASLDEFFATILGRTGIRPLVGVYSMMPLEVGLAIEALFTTR